MFVVFEFNAGFLTRFQFDVSAVFGWSMIRPSIDNQLIVDPQARSVVVFRSAYNLCALLTLVLVNLTCDVIAPLGGRCS